MFVKCNDGLRCLQEESVHGLKPRKLTNAKIRVFETDEQVLEFARDRKNVTIQTNGIINDPTAAIETSLKHAIKEDRKAGYFMLYNLTSGSALNDAVYAGFDKFNEVCGGCVAPSQTTRVLADLVVKFTQQGKLIDVGGHSRGTMTIANMITKLKKEGIYNPNIRSIMNFGPAANIEKMAYSAADVIRDHEVAVGHSTHKKDLVGTVIGGNPSTGGNQETGFIEAHTTGLNIPEAAKAVKTINDREKDEPYINKYKDTREKEDKVFKIFLINRKTLEKKKDKEK